MLKCPVMGHIGLTPQSLHKMGGYKVQGKDFSGIERLVKDAVALDKAGVFSIVLEGVPREVAAMITREVSAPTIGIGAGPDCDGQVLVFHDLVNLTFHEPAKFVRQYGDAAALFTNAVEQFKADVETRRYPSRRRILPSAERHQGGAGSDSETQGNEGVCEVAVFGI